MLKFSMFETADKDSLLGLFDETGVELSDGEQVQCWAITYGEENEVVGGAVLSKLDGVFILDGLAMKPEYQRIKLGKELTMMVIEKALVSKAEALYAAAIFPGFFRAVGFTDVEPEDVPDALKEKAAVVDEEGRRTHILKIPFR